MAWVNDGGLPRVIVGEHRPVLEKRMSESELHGVDGELSTDAERFVSMTKARILRETVECQRVLDGQARLLQGLRKSVGQYERAMTGTSQGRTGFLSMNANGMIVAVNNIAAGLLGEGRERLVGRRLSALIIPDEREHWHRFLSDTLAHRGAQAGELSLQLADGAVIDTHFNCQTVQTAAGECVLRIALTDISELKRVARELSDCGRGAGSADAIGSQATVPDDNWLRGVIEQSLAGIYLIQGGRFAYANQGFADIFGYDSPGEIIGRVSVGDLIVPEDREKVAENIRRRTEGQVPEMRYTFTGLRKDGSRVEVEVHGRRMEFEGRPAVIGVILDISDRKQAEQQLRIAATAFEAQEGMMVTDANAVVLRINEAFTAITGYAASEIVGRTPRVLSSGRHDRAFYASMWANIHAKGTWQGEIWDRRKNGEVFPEWITITSVRNPEGEVTNYVATFTDITERKAAESEIEYLAFYDQLTRLPNRRLLLDRLQQALAASARSGAEGALLFIDLDNFKDLNDTLGHEKGDLLLKLVAERLSDCVRDGDTVARLGGDEFVMMVEGLSSVPEEAAAQSKRIGEKILNALNQPYPLVDREHHSTPSIGVTLFSDQKDNVDELMKRADLAMYKAKQAGRNTLCFFDPRMQAAVMAWTTMEADMRVGLRDKQFVLHYQAQVNNHLELIGVEALLRWQHPERGLVSPAEFIPVAEVCGLILPLGQWVLESACRQLVRWGRDARTAHLTIAVNVSARQFHHPAFVDRVLAAIDESGANPERLKLELTESLLLSDVDDVIDKMTALKQRGVGFSLDDFGTGYSSLAYLKRLPLDQLKIDQSFVSDIVTNANDAAITNAIVSLAHNLGLSVIAEGVETESQCAYLARQGCHAYQGFLFGRPGPVELLEAMLAPHAPG